MNTDTDATIKARDIAGELWEAAIRCDFDAFKIEVADALAPTTNQAEWQTGTPPTKAGSHDEYIVAVRRASNPHSVFVFAATYANQFEDEMCTRDGEEFIADGWFNAGLDMSGEFNNVYEPMLATGDEVVGWKALPKWSDRAPTPSAQEEAVRVPEGYAFVPLKPNDAMQAAGAQAVRIDTTVLNRMWTANRVFQAMVEAAASAGDQEVGA